MIRVSDRFAFERDTYGWQLHDWRAGTGKEGQPIRAKRTTYHPTLEQACAAVIDRAAGDAESLAGIIAELDDAREQLRAALDGLRPQQEGE